MARSRRLRTLEDPEEVKTMRERLLTLRPDDERRWGVMSAGETACHLHGAFRVAMGEIACDPVTLAMPRWLLKAGALWVPMRWPRNVKTVPVLERGAPALKGTDFAADQRDAIAVMQRFCEPAQKRVRHAMFGPMSFGDWMRWGFLHTDHHLRQFGR